MQTLELSPALADATAKVLESMFFTTVLGETAEAEEQSGLWIAAKLTFEGHPSGRFGVGVTRTAACLLAANFLGIDTDELSSMQIDEVVGELTNMIAGSFLSGLESRSCFALSHPEIELPEQCSEWIRSADTRIFELEDGFVAVWLEIHF